MGSSSKFERFGACFCTCALIIWSVLLHIESSGSSSLLASGQVGENNHSEAARANDNVGNVNLLEGIIDVDLLDD
jgi:hypothetical protein